ncbi:MAG: toxin-antitoxin system YwqK family antitoxin [Chlamydiia bacterium]|nr:toxin-antitoxin system YwqK family antitoxin [Chlamydiia bacterium]
MGKQMKKLLLLSLLTLVTGCRNHNYQSDVVKETYVHRYGVSIPKNDWERQGRDGQIVQLCKNGVTITRSYLGGSLNGKTTFTFPNSTTIERIQTYEHGVLISDLKNYETGVPCLERRFEGENLTKVTGWYEDGTPSLTESYADGYLTSGEYRNLLNIIESRVENGRGIRIKRDQEGELLFRDNIQNGQMVERITYYPNGDPSAVVPYDNGLVNGQRLTFLQGGLPNTVEQWVHGKQEGITIIYQNGEKISETPYLNGEKNGIEKRFRNGQELVAEATWKNGVLHGQTTLFVGENTQTEWYHEGKMVSRNTYERMNLR